MENKNKSKIIIFWMMILAGAFWLISVFVGYFENNKFSIINLIISLILIGLAIGYKYQQKI